jgi:hypothetical protein
MSPERIIAAYQRVRSGQIAPRIPALWDGRAAERIAEILLGWK